MLQVAMGGEVISSSVVFEYKARDLPALPSSQHDWLSLDGESICVSLSTQGCTVTLIYSIMNHYHIESRCARIVAYIRLYGIVSAQVCVCDLLFLKYCVEGHALDCCMFTQKSFLFSLHT